VLVGYKLMSITDLFLLINLAVIAIAVLVGRLLLAGIAGRGLEQ
jgi:hypothetical protein